MKKVLIIISLVMFSCQVKNEVSENEKSEFKKNVYKSGDEESYKALIMNCYDSEESFELFPITYLMASKYNSGYACRNLYEGIIEINNDYKVKNNKGQFQNKLLLNLSKADREFAIFYLIKGSSLNDSRCNKNLSELYLNGWGVERNEQKADSLFKLYEKNLGID